MSGRFKHRYSRGKDGDWGQLGWEALPCPAPRPPGHEGVATGLPRRGREVRAEPCGAIPKGVWTEVFSGVWRNKVCCVPVLPTTFG